MHINTIVRSGNEFKLMIISDVVFGDASFVASDWRLLMGVLGHAGFCKHLTSVF